MKRLLNHSAMPAVGFVEPWSVKAGDDTEVFVSANDPRAQVRILSLDRDDPEVMDWPVSHARKFFEVREYQLGSWVELPSVALVQLQEWHLSVEFLLTRNDTARCFLAIGDLCRVEVDELGRLSGKLNDQKFEIGTLRNETWAILNVHVDSSRVRLEVVSRGDTLGFTSGTVDMNDLVGRPVSIGSAGTHDANSVNCRIGRIGVKAGDLDLDWRFPVSGPVTHVGAVNEPSAKLTVHNMPTFAVASARFTGEIHDPRLDPSHFDAIHLHDDDFAGFDWDPDLKISVPHNARSGIYGVEIETASGTERLPFFVRPSRPSAKLAFLVPTNTYLAYADERLPPVRYPWHGSDRGHRFSIDNHFLCLYDVHSDLSGVSLTSARRPRATLRDDYHYPLSNCPHLLPVDLQLLKFYARNSVDIDILTDRDLHDEELEAIRPYSAILTGSHPEYWSSRMMKTLDAYLISGGNLAYLGGNGFYWVVAHQDQTMELRRIKSDIWSGRPGEGHMSITGEPGGNWEDRGLRNPQAYLGVTYLIMSFGPSRPYQRLEASHGDEYSWIFSGIKNDTFGGSGTVLGGAAGYEVDAVVRSEETPRNLVRLATADGFDESFQVRPDVWLADGEVEREALRRADMTIYRHQGGGHVFCTGSVAWIGALPGRDDENEVGQIMLNLAQGFVQ